jgi:hypothetical protein
LAALERAAAIELAALPAEVIVATLVRARSRRRWLVGAPVAVLAAAAAAVCLLVLRPAEPIQLRGAGVALQRQRDGVVSTLASGGAIQVGDRLGVKVTLARAALVNLWFVDASGRVDALLPQGPIALPAGEHGLATSAIVEAPCQETWVVVGIAEAAEAATAARLRPRPGPGDDWLPQGCLAVRLRCE